MLRVVGDIVKTQREGWVEHCDLQRQGGGKWDLSRSTGKVSQLHVQGRQVWWRQSPGHSTGRQFIGHLSCWRKHWKGWDWSGEKDLWGQECLTMQWYHSVGPNVSGCIIECQRIDWFQVACSQASLCHVTGFSVLFIPRLKSVFDLGWGVFWRLR